MQGNEIEWKGNVSCNVRLLFGENFTIVLTQDLVFKIKNHYFG